ncbi:DUF1428 domain-containing protein [Shimia abyssi]|uniref:Uncharacterized protein YbaA (DUF1428 family) n=1 Tax=Shimia abyssi TaxID=1662395 RepID=A0A2P8FFZ6_9RHOB|nr:DUF1428 domain-containing protein [Shimia abyssi]PSL20634.1 uncharacterized protein YbaA (DUF1428 family) [Shimia abyssi]
MPYIDGFIAAVANDKRDAFEEHCRTTWPVFQELGAIAQWECWGEDLPEGEVTSFPMAVKAKEDETVVFSWVVWPDKAVRDKAWGQMMTDPSIGEAMGEMPYDGKRMIYGGFQPIFGQGDINAMS